VTPQLTLDGFQGSVDALTFFPDGKTLAVADESFAVRTFDLKNGRIAHRFGAHSDTIRAIAFTRDGGLMATGGLDRAIRIWDAKRGSLRTKFPAPSCHSLAFSPDSGTLAAGCYDPADEVRFLGLQLWSVDGRLLSNIGIADTTISALSYSPNGAHLAMGSQHMYCMNTYTHVVQRFKGTHQGTVRAVTFANGGRWIVSGSPDHQLRIWDVGAGGQSMVVLHEETGSGCYDRILAVSCNSDKRLIATCSMDRTIRVWEEKGHSLRRKVLLGNPASPHFTAWRAAFSNDGKSLALVTMEDKVLVFTQLNWDAG
jgi:WD40 repeat protein